MPYLGRQRPQETTANVLRSTYTGNGSTTTYNLPGPVANETAIIATINGVTQQDTAYTTNGTQIIFAAAPALGDAIELRTISAVAMSYTPPDGSVVTGKIADLAVTTGKIADNSITTAKIAAGAVVQADLASGVAGTGPAFAAYQGTTQTLTSGVYTKIALNVERFDTNNNFDSTTNYRFTPTVAGYYQINYEIYAGTTSTITQLVGALYKNGSAYEYGIINTINNSQAYTSSSLVYMNGTTDYLELYINVAGAGTLTATEAGGATNFMSGVLVRAA